MALEAGTYVSDFVTTNPTVSDPIAQGQNHLQLIKTLVKNTFPNINGAVTATQAALNAIAASLSGNTLTIPGGISSGTDGKMVLQGATISGVANPNLQVSNAAGTLRVLKADGTTVLASVDASGNVNAPLKLQEAGNSLVPRGVICMWSGATNAVPAGWGLCDGTAGTPDLRNAFILGAGSTYSALSTGGSTTFSGTSNTAGAHSHGGSSGNAGSHTHAAGTDVAGNHSHGGSSQGHALTVSEMPSHAHVQMVFNSGPVGGPTSQPAGTGGSNSQDSVLSTEPTGGGLTHSHGIPVDGAHAHTITVTGVGDHAHSIASDGSHSHTVAVAGLPPFVALGYIMKL